MLCNANYWLYLPPSLLLLKNSHPLTNIHFRIQNKRQNPRIYICLKLQLRNKLYSPNFLKFSLFQIPVDLFIQYQDTKDAQKRDYIPGIDFEHRQELRWYMPHVSEICAGALLQSLVYVPCNVEAVLTVS
jgi:hypothetical protein